VTNYLLLAVASICLAAAIWWATKRTSAAAAPVVLAFILFVQALGGPVWEWAKWSSGAGLPPTVAAAAFTDSKAVPAFLWAAIGASLSALLVPRQPATLAPSTVWEPSRRVSITVIAAGVFSFCGFVIGEGPSFLRREIYLQAEGPVLVLRMFWPLGVLWGLLAIVLLMVEKDVKLRIGLVAVAILWYIGPAAVGSRLALGVPLTAVFVITYHQINGRRIHLPILGAAVLLSMTAVFTFSVILQARGMPHGLLNLPKVAAAVIDGSTSSTDSYLMPVKQLASSIFVSVPNAEQSAIYGVDPHVLIANANILPGTSQAMELERYWPYEWVPLSFAGMWYGTFGWFAQLLWFGSVGWLCGYASYNIQRSSFPILSIAPLGIGAIIGLLSIQYSSRMVWRIVSILLVMAVVGFLTRRSLRWHPPLLTAGRAP
jgi:iron complex transport system permease protein